MAVKTEQLRGGERLKEICKRKELSLNELAERIGYGPAQLYNITAVKSTRNVSKNMAREIKRVFPDIRLEYLLGVDEYMTMEDISESRKAPKIEVTVSLKGLPAEVAEIFNAVPDIRVAAGDSFAQVFSTLLEATNTSNLEIADLLQISPQAVSNYRNGLTEPSIEKLIKIADFFSVSLDFLTARKPVVQSC